MPDIYKKSCLFFAAAAFATLASCEKDETPDTEAPTINLEISGNPEKLYNEITLRSSISSNDGIERVVFYINSDSIGQALEEPYELSWNTKEVEDGRHMLKATAYEANGSKTEAAKEVTIKNTLFVMDVENGYYQTEEGTKDEDWIFLSDKGGNIIGEVRQVANGVSLRWERPSDFYSDTIYLSKLNKYTVSMIDKSYEYLTLTTYTNVTLEESILRSNSSDSVGKVDITIENDFDGSYYYTYKTAFPNVSASHYTNWPTTGYALSMTQNRQKGFSTYEKMVSRSDQHLREKFYRIDELEVGSSYTFHTREYTAMEGKTIQIPLNFKSLSVSTFGAFNTDERRYWVDWTYGRSDQSQEVKAFYADDFPVIYTTLRGSIDNKAFTHSIMDKAPEVVSVPDYSLGLESENQNTVKVTSSHGTFDVGNKSWHYAEENETKSISVSRSIYFSSKPGLSYVLPEIPATLLELHPALNQPLEDNIVYMMDNKSLNSYNEILEHWLKDTYYSRYWEYSSLNIFPENTGGRILSAKDANSVQEEMEKEYLRARGIFKY